MKKSIVLVLTLSFFSRDLPAMDLPVIMPIESNDLPIENTFDALLKAIKGNKVDDVRKLVSSNASLLDARDTEETTHTNIWEEKQMIGATALHWASAEGSVDCVRVLLELHANVQATSLSTATPLHWAAGNGQTDCVRLLLANNAPIDKFIIYDGYTPTEVAAMNGHDECVKLLLESKASINSPNIFDGATLLHRSVLNGHETCARTLLQLRANVHATPKDGATALHWAAISGQLGCVKLLVISKAQVDATAQDGRTALDWAAQYNKPNCVQFLTRVLHVQGSTSSN